MPSPKLPIHRSQTTKRFAFLLSLAALAALAPAQATYWKGGNLIDNFGRFGYWNDAVNWNGGIPVTSSGVAYNYVLDSRIFVPNNGVVYGARKYIAGSASLYNNGQLQIVVGGLSLIDDARRAVSFAAVGTAASTYVQGFDVLLDYGNLYSRSGGLTRMVVDTVTNRNDGYMYSTGVGSRLFLTANVKVTNTGRIGDDPTTIAAYAGGVTSVRTPGTFQNDLGARVFAQGSGSSLRINLTENLDIAGSFKNQNGSSLHADNAGSLQVGVNSFLSDSGSSVIASLGGSLNIRAGTLQFGAANGADASTIQARSGGSIRIAGLLTVLKAGNTASATGTGSALYFNDVDVAGTPSRWLNNRGTVSAEAGGLVSMQGETINNNGKIEASGANSTVSLYGRRSDVGVSTIYNSIEGTSLARIRALNGGTVMIGGVSGTTFHNNFGVFNNVVDSDGQGSTIAISVPTLNEGLFAARQGTIEILGSASSFDSSGEVFLTGGATFHAESSSAHLSGSLDISLGYRPSSTTRLM